MATTTTAPLAIGTRGTVGSLLRREIEYFQRIEQDPVSKQFAGVSENGNTDNSNPRSRTSLGSLLMIGWRRKRRRSSSGSYSSFSRSSSSGFLPRMCYAVEVSESEEFDGIPGFSYRNMRAGIGNIDL